jgi:hypothetical protein
VVAKLLILQVGAEPLSSVALWAEPSQLLVGMWLSALFGATFRESRVAGTTGDVARDLSVLTVELSGKSSDNSWPRRNSMKLRIEFMGPRGGRATGWVSNGFGIDGGMSNENGDSMFLLVARGVFIGAAAAR